MSRVGQTLKIVELLIDMLESNEQELVLQQLNVMYGQQEDVARMYTDHELAERYDVHVATVRKWIADGRLKACRLNNRWYSRADWLNEFEIRNIKT